MSRVRSLSLLAPVLLAAVAPSCKSSSSGGPPSAPPPDPFADIPVTPTKIQIDHLTGPVSVARDAHGTVHIAATTITDALRVEGYQVARDRTVQLELNRRSATGRLAEVLGDASPGLIDQDIAMRTIGLNREGQAMYDALDPSSEARQWLDAYADGISQFSARAQSGEESIPPSMLGFPRTAFAPWTGADVLAVARLQAWNLAYEGPSDIDNSAFVAAAAPVFAATSSDPLAQKRAGFLADVVRFAPLDATTVLPGFPGATSSMPRAPVAAPRVGSAFDPGLYRAAGAWSDATKAVHARYARYHFGSNDWVVAPSLSANGHAMLANDPHLSLSAPATFWAVQVQVTSSDPAQSLSFEGMSFPGLVGIILGFNDHVAWGATDAFFDISDVYAEKLTPDGSAVVWNGQNVALQKAHEEIKVANSPPVEYDVLVVPHHGPIVPTIVNHAVVAPDPTKGALSVRWTGDAVTRDIDAIMGLVRAKTVDDALTALDNFAVGAENWVLADTNGDIGYSSSAIVPLRDKRAFTWSPATMSGTLPCFTLPGDGTAEWTGAVDRKFLPRAKNPSDGYLVTANNDQVGTTVDDDPSNDKLPDGTPAYLQCFYDTGLRAGRITRDITGAGHPLSIDDLAAIQADARSNVGPLVLPSILVSLGHAQEEKATPGTHADLTAIVADPRYAAANVAKVVALFTQWESSYDTPAGVSLDDGSPSSDPGEIAASEATLLFNAWMVAMERATFADELAKIGVTAPP
jgi:penicillin amidase